MVLICVIFNSLWTNKLLIIVISLPHNMFTLHAYLLALLRSTAAFMQAHFHNTSPFQVNLHITGDTIDDYVV